MKELPDDNPKFVENNEMLSETVKNTGKRRHWLSQVISSFLTVFSKDM